MTKKFLQDKFIRSAQDEVRDLYGFGKLELEENLRVREFDDIDLVLEMGAKKHGAVNWLQPDGKKSSMQDMHMSMIRHLTQSYLGIRKDEESGLDHLLHLACRALMMYTLLKRGIRENQEGDLMPFIEQVFEIEDQRDDSEEEYLKELNRHCPGHDVGG